MMKGVFHICGNFQNKLFAQLVDEMASLGFDQKVFFPAPIGSNRNKNPHPLALYRECYRNYERLCFTIKERKILEAFKASCDFSAIGAIHAHTLFSDGCLGLWAKRTYGIPYIVAVRSTDEFAFFAKRPWLRGKGVEVLNEASKVIFLSPAFQERILNRYVPYTFRDAIWAKSSVIPNGISPLFFEHAVDPKKMRPNGVRLIYVGDISNRKNLETTIKAMRYLPSSMDVMLVVVGQITSRKYRSLIEKTLRIEYHEKCPQEEILCHFADADIFVMPSHHETFGLVYAEAMSQGLPVLYTRGQGFDGHFEEGEIGYSVLDTDPQDVANSIIRVVENYEALSARCIERAHRFDWKTISKEYANIYESLLC